MSMYNVLLVFFFIVFVSGQEEGCLEKRSEECVNKFERPDDNGNLIFDFIVPRNPQVGMSLSKAIMNHKESYPETKKAIDNLKIHFEKLFQEWKSNNDTFESSSLEDKARMEPVCTLGVDPRLKNRALYYGFGLTHECGFEFKGESQKRKSDLDTEEELRPKFVTKNVKAFSDGLNVVKDDVVKNYQLDWNTSYINDEMIFSDDTETVRQCTTYRAMAFKVNGEWALAGKIAKRPWNYYAPSREKQILTEFISGSEQLEPLTLTIPKCDFCAVAQGFNKSTASLWYGKQNDDWGYFWEKYHRDQTNHPALKLALSQSEHEKELVEDSGALSNAAILMLPVLLTLLPLGLFQEVSAKFLILYSLVTDVFSCMPIIIRGIELLVVGYKEYNTITSKLYGSTLDKELVIGQAWTARCTVTSTIRTRGYFFLIFGICALLLGISLELVAWYLTRKAKARLQDKKEALLKQDKPIDIIEQEADNVGLLWYIRNKV